MLTFHPQADTFISLKFGILEDSSQCAEALLSGWKLTVFLTHQRGQLSVSYHAFCALYLNTKENDLLDKMFSFILIFALILSLTHFSSFLTLTQTEALYECVNKSGIGSKGNISVTSIRTDEETPNDNGPSAATASLDKASSNWKLTCCSRNWQSFRQWLEKCTKEVTERDQKISQQDL